MFTIYLANLQKLISHFTTGTSVWSLMSIVCMWMSGRFLIQTWIFVQWSTSSGSRVELTWHCTIGS